MLKTPEEQREFLRNIGIEYRYGCYDQKHPEACELLAEYFELIEMNIPKSTKLYARTCDTWSLGKSCHCYANALFYGRGTEKDYLKSLDYYSKACLSGHAVSCFNAGQLHFSYHEQVRKVIPQDLDKAITMFEKGCALNNPDACSLGTYMYHSNFVGTRSTKNDPARKAEYETKAFKLAERGCKLNEMNSCVYLAKAYQEGLGCEKNKEKRKEIAEKIKVIAEQFRPKNKPSQFQRYT